MAACYLLLPWAPGSLPWLWSRADERSASLAQLNEELGRLVREQESLRLEGAFAPLAAVPAATAGERRSLGILDRGASASWDRSAPPSQEPGVLVPPAEFEYTVKPGDTMWEISASFIGDPLAFRELARRNGIANPDLIFPGQRILLPRPAAALESADASRIAP